MTRNSSRAGAAIFRSLLWKTYSAVRQFAVRDIDKLGLTLTDFAILEALLNKGPLAVNDIGAKVALTSGSMTTAIDRLKSRGLVERDDEHNRPPRQDRASDGTRSQVDLGSLREACGSAGRAW